jgi:transposase
MPLPMPGLPELTPERWAQVALLVPSGQGRPVGDARRVVEGILWVMRTGSSWRALPEQFGPWSTVADRYRHWRKEGVWERICTTLLASDVPFASSA